jgi:DNA-binding HxlR family transcriptional regulator
MATKVNKSPDCVLYTLSILGDKWSLLIVREMTSCPQSFSDLESSLEGISPRTLSMRLNKLIEGEIISKALYCVRPPRYQYSLTEKGADLKNILKDMSAWGKKYA